MVARKKAVAKKKPVARKKALAKEKARREAPAVPGNEQQVFDTLLKEASDARMPGLNKFAQLQKRRAKRMGKTGKRLEKSLGRENPRVIALGREATRATRFHTDASVAAKRESRKPRVAPHEWAIFGEVVDENGRPVAGLQVQLVNKKQRTGQTKIAAETDEFGDFFLLLPVEGIVPPDRAIEARKRTDLDLRLRISDNRGAEQFLSSKPLRPQAGSADYFGITLVNAGSRRKAHARKNSK